MLAIFREQPRPFYMIFLLEIWERFGFYTVQGILTLYFIRYLNFSEQASYYTFGAFSALVYGMISLGGYLGDKVLGTKRTIVLGLIILATGYLALAICTPPNVFYALALVCVGNGLFKANPASLLSKCYEKGDKRLHGGYTLYYMAVNIGSTFALFVGPTVSSHFGYFYAYFLSFIGILLGLANYWFQRKHIQNIKTYADEKSIPIIYWVAIFAGILIAVQVSAILLQHVKIAKNLVLAITTIVVLIYFFQARKQNKQVRLRMLVAFILMLEAIVFFTLYQQMPTSLNLFAVKNVTPHIFGLSLDPQSFQALNPIWIILLSPILTTWYYKRHLNNKAFPIPYKFALGMTCAGFSFLLLYFSRFVHSDTGMVSSWWLIFSYMLQSLGELLVSALGVAMVAELVPGSISGFVMGMWFLTSAMAGFIGAYVASFTTLPKNVTGIESLTIYTQVFAYIGVVTLVIALLLWLVCPFLTRLVKKAPI